MLPVVPPLQVSFTTTGVAVTTAGWVIVAVVVPEQPLPSFTVIVYVFAPKLLNTLLPWKAPPSEYVYPAPDPPPAVTVIFPVVPPLQVSFTTTALAVTAVGWVIICVVVPGQPLPSSTVSV